MVDQLKRRINQEKYIRTARGRYRELKTSATMHNKQLDITFEEFVKWRNKQPLFCYYCGKFLIANGRDRDSLTVDRKDNNGSYNKDNMVIACLECNGRKMDKLAPSPTERRIE